MNALVFRAKGINRILWGTPSGEHERPDLTIEFFDRRGRLISRLTLRGFQIDPWTIQEGLYDKCDEVRVLDGNADGGQLEFGRYVVRFMHRGEVRGEHTADSIIT